MTLLSHNALIERIAKQKVLALPGPDGTLIEIDFNHVNSASIDICLGKFILEESVPTVDGVLDYKARDKMNFRRVEIPAEGYILRPGEFILAESAEIFSLPLDISAEYKLKSSMARMGLEHLNAGWADAGWTGSVLTLEFKNMSRYHAIRLRPGDAIGQMVFFSHEPVSKGDSYAARGRYNNDTTVTESKADPVPEYKVSPAPENALPTPVVKAKKSKWGL